MAAKAAFAPADLEARVSEDWVVETRWIETGCPLLSLSNESPVGARNGNFSMQRQGDKISDFGTYSTAETAQTKKPGTHVFDISAVLRVSLSNNNYREWVVGRELRSLKLNRKLELRQ
jgi:hypothetical protein